MSVHELIVPHYNGELGRQWRECTCGDWIASGSRSEVADRFALHLESERIVADESWRNTYDMPNQ